MSLPPLAPHSAPTESAQAEEDVRFLPTGKGVGVWFDGNEAPLSLAGVPERLWEMSYQDPEGCLDDEEVARRSDLPQVAVGERWSGGGPGPQASSSQSSHHPAPTHPSLPPNPVPQDETRMWGGREDTQRGSASPTPAWPSQTCWGLNKKHGAWHTGGANKGTNQTPSPLRYVPTPAYLEWGREEP